MSTETKTESSCRWRVAGICLVLAAMTFAVFGQTLRYDFIDFDDNEYVYENPIVSQGLTAKGFVWAFDRAHSANWHPLTWLSHMADCQLYGLRPGGHHLSSVLIHIATVIALFLVLRQMTGAMWRSAFVAAVFAIHPLRAESVAWVAERKDVLSGFFFVLTIGAYVSYTRHGRSWVRYGLVALLFVLGLMCKPMLVTLPVVLLLLDYWPLQRKESTASLIIEKLPLLALCAASCVVTLVAQHGAMQSTEAVSLPVRFGNAFTSCLVYLGQMFWPVGLAAFYPFKNLAAGDVGLAGLLVVAFSVVVWRERAKQPWLFTGWFWYLTMLLPVIGLVQVGSQAHADRYTYLPEIGIAMAVTWMAAEWGSRQRMAQPAFGAVMAAVLVVLMCCGWKQTSYWKNGETLWNHTLACTTKNDVAHLNLGHDLLKKGRLDDAIAFYQKGLQTEPASASSENNLGNAFCAKGQLDEGIVHYQKALQIKPAFAEALFNLGKAFRLEGKVDEAIAQFQKALEIEPGMAPAHNSLGNVLLQQGKAREAVPHFQKVLEINPNDAGVHLNLGLSYFQLGEFEEAIAQYETALRLKPGDERIQNNLAWLLASCSNASLRNGSRAVELAQQADTLSGGKNPVILHTLAAALAEAGRFPEAVATAQRALGLLNMQSNRDMASQLQSEIKLYQAGKPFYGPAGVP